MPLSGHCIRSRCASAVLSHYGVLTSGHKIYQSFRFSSHYVPYYTPPSKDVLGFPEGASLRALHQASLCISSSSSSSSNYSILFSM